MQRTAIVVGLIATMFYAASALAVQRGVTEIDEGTVRQVYMDRPLVGAHGYVVADWEEGDVRVHVSNFPASSTGYEVFLFQIDIPAFSSKLFVGGVKANGVVANPPPFGEVAGLISQWRSIGDLTMGDDGNGTLEYKGGGNIAATGLNMIMIFEKVTPGQHAGPEDVSKLMVECNGPLAGLSASAGMEASITVFAGK